MNDWITDSYYPKGNPNAPPCGTMCCIAGAAVIVGTYVKNRNDMLEFGGSVSSKATELLGLSWSQGEDLFYVSGWPQELLDRWEETNSIEDEQTQRFVRVELGCQRIDHLIATDE